MCFEDLQAFIKNKKSLTRKELLEVFLQYASRHCPGGDLMTTVNGDDWDVVTAKSQQSIIKDFLKEIKEVEITNEHN